MRKQRKYCKVCIDIEMWLTLRQLFVSLESGIMPCGHPWWAENDRMRELWEFVEEMEEGR